mmetsp:Transcript_17731/g.46145  ORF Transcript_17731/g.46145 Transcript_17731/m.46145 type:complete len:385 (+) Transcript_17731:314-1468(+)
MEGTAGQASHAVAAEVPVWQHDGRDDGPDVQQHADPLRGDLDPQAGHALVCLKLPVGGALPVPRGQQHREVRAREREHEVEERGRKIELLLAAAVLLVPHLGGDVEGEGLLVRAAAQRRPARGEEHHQEAAYRDPGVLGAGGALADALAVGLAVERGEAEESGVQEDGTRGEEARLLHAVGHHAHARQGEPEQQREGDEEDVEAAGCSRREEVVHDADRRERGCVRGGGERHQQPTRAAVAIQQCAIEAVQKVQQRDELQHEVRAAQHARGLRVAVHRGGGHRKEGGREAGPAQELERPQRGVQHQAQVAAAPHAQQEQPVHAKEGQVGNRHAQHRLRAQARVGIGRAAAVGGPRQQVQRGRAVVAQRPAERGAEAEPEEVEHA